MSGIWSYAACGELGGDHLRVIDHQQIAGTQHCWKVTDMAVTQLGPDHQQARGLARRCRMLRNAVWRQVEIELGGATGEMAEDPTTVS